MQVCASFYMAGALVAALLSVIACFCKQTQAAMPRLMQKQFTAAGAVAVAAVACVGVVSLQENNQPAADADGVTVAEQTSTEGVSMNYADNAFVNTSLEDMIAIPQETWLEKRKTAKLPTTLKVSTPRVSAPLLTRPVWICTATPMVLCTARSAVHDLCWRRRGVAGIRLLVYLR